MGAWFESTPDGVLFSVRMRSADAPRENTSYMVSFEHDGARVTAAVVVGSKGQLHSHLGPPDWNRNRAGAPDAMGSPLDKERSIPGTPAIARALIPWSALPGLSIGDVLRDPYAGTGTYLRGWTDADGRQVDGGYTVERVLLPVGLQRNPWIVLSLTTVLGAALAGGGYVLWQKRHG